MSAPRARETEVRRIALPGGETIPILGAGTWGLAERPQRRAEEMAALQIAVDLGMTVIDTAEMYGDGAAEELVAEALSDRRSEIFLVSKVLPEHATRRGTIAACEASLRRLKTDRLDLYLLHWRGDVSLDETVEGFDALARQGKIRHWGVSNFDVDDMTELAAATPPGRSTVAADQVLYNLMRRGIEYELLPACQAAGVPIMAYSPLEHGRLVTHRALKGIADRLHATPAQIALAWLLGHQGVIAIPKASHIDHVRDVRRALGIELTGRDRLQLEAVFPAPRRKTPLEMI